MSSTVLTKAQVGRVLKWAQQTLGLDEYDIRLDYAVERPDWAGDVGAGIVGCVATRVEWADAVVWVAKVADDEDGGPVHTALHELLHIAFEDAGIDADSRNVEKLMNKLATVMEVVCRKNVRLPK